MMREHLVAAVDRLGRIPLSLHQLLFRLAMAGVFLRAGLTKVASWEPTVALFRDEYKVPVLSPEVAAVMASTFELGCSVLLIAGLATRLATLPLLGMILTIQLFVYPQAWSEHLVWGSILLFLLTRGAGSISLDRVLATAAGPSGSRDLLEDRDDDEQERRQATGRSELQVSASRRRSFGGLLTPRGNLLSLREGPLQHRDPRLGRAGP